MSAIKMYKMHKIFKTNIKYINGHLTLLKNSYPNVIIYM